MNMPQPSFHARGYFFVLATAFVLAAASTTRAGVTVNQLDDAAAWPGTPIISTTGAGNLMTDFNVEVTINPTECANTTACSGAATHTFVPTEPFQLDKLTIRLAGAPTTGELYLFPEPVGGADTDGFTNVSFSTSLLNGGVGLPFTFFGTPTRSLMEFDFTEGDEIFLSAGTKYAVDIRNTGSGAMYWMRVGNAAMLNLYPSGNIYETGDNTQPGERFAVADGPRDGTLAVYAVGFSPPGVQGDYNNNGSVDAADYALWRNGGPLQNEVDTPGTVNDADYDAWRARFGNTSNLGSGSAVPEPAAWLLVLVAITAVGSRRRTA